MYYIQFLSCLGNIFVDRKSRENGDWKEPGDFRQFRSESNGKSPRKSGKYLKLIETFLFDGRLQKEEVTFTDF